MSYRGISLVAVLILSLAAWAHGQTSAMAILVDEHSLVPCDDTLARLDAWYEELRKHPDSVGLAVISGPPEQKHKIAFRQRLMQAYSRHRAASDVLRFKYVRAASAGEVRVQLWRVPAGAGEPGIENVDMSFVLPKTMKPFILDKEYEIEDPICYFVTEGDVFAEFLKGNPAARANIVVWDRTLAGARKTGARIVRRLVRTGRFDRSRIRIFPRNRSIPRDYAEPIVEYWFLP